MATSKIEIIKRAASATGNGGLVSIDDNAEIARLTAEHYDAIVEETLCEHGWKFARRVEPMQLTTVVPEYPWAQAWRKPPGLLSLQYIQSAGGQRLDHEERDTVQGACCVVNSVQGVVFAVGTYRVAEDRWPADYAMVVQHRMEAIFLSAIAEQRDQADDRDRLAAGKQQRSRVRDQRASTADDPGEWDLAAARNRRGAWDNRGYRGAVSAPFYVPPGSLPAPPSPPSDEQAFDYAQELQSLVD